MACRPACRGARGGRLGHRRRRNAGPGRRRDSDVHLYLSTASYYRISCRSINLNFKNQSLLKSKFKISSFGIFTAVSFLLNLKLHIYKKPYPSTFFLIKFYFDLTQTLTTHAHSSYKYTRTLYPYEHI